MEKFKKQVYEVFPIDADFSAVLGTTETLILATSTVEAVDKGGTDVSAAVLESASKAIITSAATAKASAALQIVVKAGAVASGPYTIRFKAVTSLGFKWQVDVSMTITA